MNHAGQNFRALKISLHGELVGYLTGSHSGRTAFSFAESFRSDSLRPTFTLSTHPQFKNGGDHMAKPWVRNQKLHPVFSNLLPEGALREYLARSLKVHRDHEFALLAQLGKDLPGAIIAEPVSREAIPPHITHAQPDGEPESFDADTKGGFSLAGIQMKFSMKEMDGRFNMSSVHSDELGDWIVKTPSTVHKNVPENEYTAMTLAAHAGVSIPEIRLIDLKVVDGLPELNMPNERYAYGIKRFDRSGTERIHSEDFAQILQVYPHQKYGAASYEQIGKIIYQYSAQPLDDIKQCAARLVVNILLANGDAHLKNWSVTYPDKVTPRLSEAYDIVTTKVYVEDETTFALNIDKHKDWYGVSLDHFESWTRRVGAPWPIVKSHLQATIDRARATWPSALKDLPMTDRHKIQLRQHWQRLLAEFRVEG